MSDTPTLPATTPLSPTMAAGEWVALRRLLGRAQGGYDEMNAMIARFEGALQASLPQPAQPAPETPE